MCAQAFLKLLMSKKSTENPLRITPGMTVWRNNMLETGYVGLNLDISRSRFRIAVVLHKCISMGVTTPRVKAKVGTIATRFWEMQK